LQVYPMEQWRALSERVSSLSLGNAEARALRRLLFAGAFDTELDRQGRILIPASLRDYANIGETAIVVGMHTYCEIWSQDHWRDARMTLEDAAAAIAEQMSALGI
jgi:MraZ protein